MRRQWRVLVPVLLFVTTMAGCQGCDSDTPTFVHVVALTVNPAGPITMQVGQTTTLQADATSRDGPAAVSFSSSDAGVATVDGSSGKVTCVSPGTATITVRSPDLSKTVAVTCTAAVLIAVTPTSVPFDHKIGVTTCPQKIGTLKITNLSSGPITVTLTPSSTALALDATNVTVPANGSTDVGVSFNCSVQGSFSATITLVASNGVATDTKAVAIQATIGR